MEDLLERLRRLPLPRDGGERLRRLRESEREPERLRDLLLDLLRDPLREQCQVVWRQVEFTLSCCSRTCDAHEIRTSSTRQACRCHVGSALRCDHVICRCSSCGHRQMSDL
jgi:hypothetical protein